MNRYCIYLGRNLWLWSKWYYEHLIKSKQNWHQLLKKIINFDRIFAMENCRNDLLWTLSIFFEKGWKKWGAFRCITKWRFVHFKINKHKPVCLGIDWLRGKSNEMNVPASSTDLSCFFSIWLFLCISTAINKFMYV